MRRGYRRGQEIADALRIEVRELEDRDDLGPRSSPSSPDSPASAASSPSPTSTTFSPGATKTASPPPGVTSTTSPPAGATTTSPPTAQPVIATSVLSKTTLVSSVLPAGSPIIPTSIDSRPSSTVRQTKPDGTASAVPANGIAEKGGDNGGGGGDGISKTAIGFGVVGAVGFLVAVGFLIWKFWWCRRKKANQEQPPRAELIASDNAPRPGAGPAGGLKRSDSSVMGSLMGHAYRAEEGGDMYDHQVGGTYMDEKRRPGSREDRDPILPREPEPVANPNNDRSESPVGSWLKRQSTRMLDPLTARASMTSSAAGGFKMTEQPRPDDSVSQFGGDQMPPTMDPRFQPPMPAMPPQYQPQQPTGEYYFPIAIDPQKVPPPPAPQRLSVAETNRTSGTWNTWGVQQHRDGKPKGWKAKLAARS
ncbi:hypothetical protein PG993_013327 [Apiospora rasikravindrae]|uniref:Uncharacterized protein n=1 Tax=Apiospora rasikravindrae TaxID=990691 RepID=A0ABR1RXB0_9PEZI